MWVQKNCRMRWKCIIISTWRSFPRFSYFTNQYYQDAFSLAKTPYCRFGAMQNGSVACVKSLLPPPPPQKKKKKKSWEMTHPFFHGKIAVVTYPRLGHRSEAWLKKWMLLKLGVFFTKKMSCFLLLMIGILIRKFYDSYDERWNDGFSWIFQKWTSNPLSGHTKKHGHSRLHHLIFLTRTFLKDPPLPFTSHQNPTFFFVDF